MGSTRLPGEVFKKINDMLNTAGFKERGMYKKHMVKE
jgi:hypothetical protein